MYRFQDYTSFCNTNNFWSDIGDFLEIPDFYQICMVRQNVMHGAKFLFEILKFLFDFAEQNILNVLEAS